MALKTTGYIRHVAAKGETFDALALAAYNEETMSNLIINANPDYADALTFDGGEIISIPVVSKATTPDTLPPWRRS